MKAFFVRYRELVLYILFGGLTTVVSIGTFLLCNLWLGKQWHLVSNLISWCFAASFAYLTNKLWVFDSKSWAWRILRIELPAFFGVRVFSLLMEEAGLWLLIDFLRFNDDSLLFTLWSFRITGVEMSKFLMQVLVVLVNYLFSKFFIFRKKTEKSA